MNVDWSIIVPLYALCCALDVLEQRSWEKFKRRMRERDGL